jgi:hypothetical protein
VEKGYQALLPLAWLTEEAQYHLIYAFLRRFGGLSGTAVVQRPTHNGLVKIDITIPDFQVKAAFRIGANPGFIANRCPLTAEIGKGHKVTGLTLLTFGEIDLFHEILLPAEVVFKVYNYSEPFDKGFFRLIAPMWL